MSNPFTSAFLATPKWWVPLSLLRKKQLKQKYSSVWVLYSVTSCVDVLDRRPSDNVAVWSDDEDFEETSIVVNEWLRNARWINHAESSVIENYQHLNGTMKIILIITWLNLCSESRLIATIKHQSGSKRRSTNNNIRRSSANKNCHEVHWEASSISEWKK